MNKACPVILRINDNQLELLAFKHPKGGSQLVKGSIKKAERLEDACIRELEEESGIQAQVVKQLGVWEANYKNQIWGICLMHYEDILPGTWQHNANDDGGTIFSFFWQPLNSPLSNDWNELYTNAFEYIKKALGK